MTLRLQSLARLVPEGARVADIGTDHAYLPIELVKKGWVNFAVASDIAPGPLRNAKKDIKRAGLQGQIALRLGAGLTTIKPADQIDTVVIAGMGGKLITSILNAGWLSGMRMPTLILQPNVAQPAVRSWLMVHNYQITKEELLREAGHSYEEIKAELRPRVYPLAPKQLLFGPLLLQKKGPVFQQKWQQQLAYLEKLITALRRARHPDVGRIWHLQAKIQLIKEEIK